MKKMDGKSKDIVAENIDKLKQLFPEAFTEGKIDFVTLKQLLGNFIDQDEERYSFTWNGKAKARMLAQTQSTGTLRPCKEESVDWDTTKNLFIEGDNLEVLKLLQKSYHKKVKMIYIDPPYNTGKDFVYKDNFKDNIKNYKEITGQIDSEGKNLSTNPETSGRYHTDWLNMMYPRLKLARNLLRDDGVIFISIDDNEVANLRKICDEIFGEENFVANVIWHKRYAASNDAKGIPAMHDHILVFQKSGAFERNLLPRTEKQNSLYKYDSNDGKGRWRPDNLTVKTVSESYLYEITNPVTGKKYSPSQGRCWLTNKLKMKEWINEGRVFFGQKGDGAPQLKRYLAEVQNGIIPNSFWSYEEVGHTDGSRKELKRLFKNSAPFDNPKPTGLLKRIIQIASNPNDLILDFFAGSATTAHSVYKINVENNNARKFLLVQLPEACHKKTDAFKAGYANIAEVSKDRIWRAVKSIREENPNYKGDLGFKVFKLDSTNIKPWEADFNLDQETLEGYVENVKPERTEEDILYEILLKYGLDLTLPIEEREISGQKVFVIGMGALVICLSNSIKLEAVEGIARLKAELNPEIMRVVFRDSGFKKDELKTNAVQILKQAGIIDIRSL